MEGALDWLLAPLSGAGGHAIAPWAAWHARAMVLGWSVLIPLGLLAARFFKVPDRAAWPARLDDRRWWVAHRWLQSIGIGAMTIGAALALGRGGAATPAAAFHAWAGWALVALGWAQVAGGMLRGTKGGPTDRRMRGDHYDMTPRRLAFERIHKSLGWLAAALAFAVTAAGLLVADAPRWMALLIGAWWLLLAAAFIALQRAGRCIDTYQAIWGPDPAHPGNARPPIGWGVVRPGMAGKDRR